MNFKNPFIIALIIVILYTIIGGTKHRLLYHPNCKQFNPKPDQVQELFPKIVMVIDYVPGITCRRRY